MNQQKLPAPAPNETGGIPDQKETPSKEKDEAIPGSNHEEKPGNTDKNQEDARRREEEDEEGKEKEKEIILAADKDEKKQEKTTTVIRQILMSTGKFPRRMDTYSGKDDFHYVPTGSRQEYLNAKMTPVEKFMWELSFEEWAAIDRDGIRPCSVSKPVQVQDLRPESSDPSHIGSKICIYSGDLTHLRVDAIVNAANDGCLGGGGVDQGVHMAAGVLLRRECSTFPGCDSGQTRITKGYHAPAKFILHTVGPKKKNQPKTLASCYATSMSMARLHGLRTLAFCSISTGVFAYPEAEAARIALETVMSQLMEFPNAFDLVCFVCFKAEKAKFYRDVYRRLTHVKG